MKPSFAPSLRKRLVISAIAVPFAMLALFHVSSNAQEKKEIKPEIAREGLLAPGLYREFSGVIQLGNYSDRPQKKNPQRYTLDMDGQNGIDSMDEYFKAPEAPHVMGATVYFAVFRNVGRGHGDTFGTGMPGGLDHHFMPGDGDFRPGGSLRASYGSPRFDTTAKYLFLFQVIASRGLDARNQMSDVQVEKISNAIKAIIGEEENNKIKNAQGEDKTKLLKAQDNVVQQLADAVNRAMMPDAAIEDVHRFSVQLNVDPRHITSWGYFENCGFAVNIAGQKEYVDRWGHRHKTVADGGVIPNDLIEDRTQACSFLPGVTELIKDVEFDRVKKSVYALGVSEGSFHVNDANVGIEKSLPYRFAQGLIDRGAEIKFASHLAAGQKKADFAVRPQRVRIVVGDDRPDYFQNRDLLEDDDDYTTSAFVVDFDQKGVQPRSGTKETRGIPRTKHSMVFGFTTNLEPNLERRVRLDDLDSTDRNKELPFREFFSEKTVAKVPARDGFSRGHDYWTKGKKGAGLGLKREFAFAGKLNKMFASDVEDELAFVLAQGGGGAAAGGGGAGASSMSISGLGVSPPSAPAAGGMGGMSGGGIGGTSGGGGGGAPTPGLGGGFSRGGGSGGGQGSGQGDTSGNGSGNAASDQKQAGLQGIVINFNALLQNQQQQSQQQGQFQFQNQNQNQSQKNRGHGHGHGHRGHDCNNNHGHVVPAPASLLLGLLGLPGLLILRRRKNAEPTMETVA